MAKYTYKIIFTDGEVLEATEAESTEEDAIFDSYGAALAAGYEALDNCRLGTHILHMSNPGDYPEDEDDIDGEVIVYKIK